MSSKVGRIALILAVFVKSSGDCFFSCIYFVFPLALIYLHRSANAPHQVQHAYCAQNDHIITIEPSQLSRVEWI